MANGVGAHNGDGGGGTRSTLFFLTAILRFSAQITWRDISGRTQSRSVNAARMSAIFEQDCDFCCQTVPFGIHLAQGHWMDTEVSELWEEA